MLFKDVTHVTHKTFQFVKKPLSLCDGCGRRLQHLKPTNTQHFKDKIQTALKQGNCQNSKTLAQDINSSSFPVIPFPFALLDVIVIRD